MPKPESNMIRIKEWRQVERQGFGAGGSMINQFRVIEVPLSEVSEETEAVDEPVTDWTEEK